MTVFYWNGNIDKLLHQNAAETEDYLEGCLQDNMLMACRRGYMAIYEHYLNPWSSNHKVFFAPYKNAPDCEKLLQDWETFKEKAERESA